MAVTVTGNDLIKDASLLAGVGDQYNPDDYATQSLAVRMLNDMLDAWSADPLLVFAVLEGVVPITVGVNTITLPGGTVTVNPSVINAVSIVDSGNNTYPCTIIGAADWAKIQYKPSSGRPEVVYFDYGRPVCTGYLYYTPAFAGDTLHVWYQQDLQNFVALTNVLVAPQGYSLAIKCSLARLMCVANGKEASAELRRQERIANRTARLGHIQPTTLPMAAPIGDGGHYNIYTDRYTR
jgi:hypothetical protein